MLASPLIPQIQRNFTPTPTSNSNPIQNPTPSNPTASSSQLQQQFGNALEVIINSNPKFQLQPSPIQAPLASASNSTSTSTSTPRATSSKALSRQMAQSAPQSSAGRKAANAQLQSGQRKFTPYNPNIDVRNGSANAIASGSGSVRNSNSNNSTFNSSVGPSLDLEKQIQQLQDMSKGTSSPQGPPFAGLTPSFHPQTSSNNNHDGNNHSRQNRTSSPLMNNKPIQFNSLPALSLAPLSNHSSPSIPTSATSSSTPYTSPLTIIEPLPSPAPLSPPTLPAAKIVKSTTFIPFEHEIMNKPVAVISKPVPIIITKAVEPTKEELELIQHNIKFAAFKEFIDESLNSDNGILKSSVKIAEKYKLENERIEREYKARLEEASKEVENDVEMK